jgi:hypothetical protein
MVRSALINIDRAVECPAGVSGVAAPASVRFLFRDPEGRPRPRPVAGVDSGADGGAAYGIQVPLTN